LLGQLAETGAVIETENDGSVQYASNPAHTRSHTLKELLDEHDKAELERMKRELESAAGESHSSRISRLMDYRLDLLEEAIGLRQDNREE
jgi:hypothetical protein